MTKAKGEESEEQREARLIKARKQATKTREEKMVEKYKDKVLAKEAKKQVKEESESDEDDEAPRSTAIIKPLKPVKPIKEEVKEEVAEEVAEEKPKARSTAITSKLKKPKAKVIIEQDSSDDEVFEASKDVIFVKRIRAKPKADVQAPQAPSVATNQPPPVTRQEQPLPERYQQQIQQQQQQQQPQRAVMTPEKRLEMERYLNMTRGNFLPMSRPR